MPRALAVPRPEDGVGPLLIPTVKLSNVQAVSVVAARTPETEAIRTGTIQTRFFIIRILFFGSGFLALSG